MIRPLIAALALSACAPATVDVSQGRVVDVLAHHTGPLVLPPYAGGNVAQFTSLARRAHATGRLIVIRHQCDSACAILASLPTACLDRGARIGLHQQFLVIREGGRVHNMGPTDDPAFYGNVTPQIAAKVRGLPFDWSDPYRMTAYITWADAPAYGVKQCQ
jgi:hypothetical protein